MEHKDPLVTVQMLAYNHEKYIAMAITSVLRQKTDFSFELVIGEDCSTDNTLTIVNEFACKYPDIIHLVANKENVGPLANIMATTRECRGKYIAILEGDDYWNDESKLQKQVEFMENNSEFGLVHSDVNHWLEERGALIERYNAAHGYAIPEGNIYCELLDPDQYIIKTPSTLFRKDLLDKHVDYGIVREQGWVIADLFTWLSMARFTKMKYFPEPMATYRVLKDSSSNTKNYAKKIALHRSVFEIRAYFAKLYPCDDAILKKINKNYAQAMLYDAFKTGDKKLAAEMELFSKDNKIYLGYKDRLLYLATQNRLLNRLLNFIW